MDKELKIFLIEQTKDDIELIDSSLKKAGFAFQFIIPESGEKALAQLTSSTISNVNEMPDLIILDVNPSGNKDFINLVKEIKFSETLKSIPLIILSSNGIQAKINEAYFFHANCYVHKPEDKVKYEEALSELWNFWLETVRLPNSQRRRLKPFSSI
jgi:CheY-like chemotaxis protein